MNTRTLAPMKLAIPTACPKGHSFYRESGNHTPCPHCMYARAVNAEVELARIKATLRMLSQDPAG